MRTWLVVSSKALVVVKVRKSKLVSDETFHQKRRVAGPTTLVRKEVVCRSLIKPLWAAATPSCDTALWPCQGATASLVQFNRLLFKATSSGRVATGGGL